MAKVFVCGSVSALVLVFESLWSIGFVMPNISSMQLLWASLSPPVKYFTDRSKAVLLLWIFYVVFFCLVFAISLCTSVYMCFVVACWERADLLALVCGVQL